MEPKKIAEALRDAGSSQAEIGRITGFTIGAVNAVIYEREGNKSCNPIIRAAIAAKLSLPVNEVFKDHIQFDCNFITILRKKTEVVNGKP